MTFTIAGRDTVGWTFTVMMYMLLLHPEIEANILEEIRNVLGNQSPSYDNVQGLVYLQAFMYETLRLYPSVSVDFKFSVKADILPDGTQIEPGDLVNYPPWMQGRDPNIWENPLEFNVNRWIVDGKFQSRTEYEYLVFNAGPRLCLGKAMATFQVKYGMVELLKNFKFRAAEPLLSQPPTRFGTTLCLSQPLHVYMEKRSL